MYIFNNMSCKYIEVEREDKSKPYLSVQMRPLVHNVKVKNYQAIKFKGPKSACVPCKLRSHCLRKPDKTEIRQVAYFTGRTRLGKQRFTEKIKSKIDSTADRAIYSLRLAIGEPPFAHIRSILGLDRFTLRGKKKVNSQWNLFCIVHNMKKIHRYGECCA